MFPLACMCVRQNFAGLDLTGPRSLNQPSLLVWQYHIYNKGISMQTIQNIIVTQEVEVPASQLLSSVALEIDLLQEVRPELISHCRWKPAEPVVFTTRWRSLSVSHPVKINTKQSTKCNHLRYPLDVPDLLQRKLLVLFQ
ncbi:hypothetical protein Tco_0115924 [Tanacetum coccineum]